MDITAPENKKEIRLSDEAQNKFLRGLVDEQLEYVKTFEERLTCLENRYPKTFFIALAFVVGIAVPGIWFCITKLVPPPYPHLTSSTSTHDTLAKVDFLTKDIANTILSSETNLSYQYQVVLGVLLIVASIIGIAQYKLSTRQHEMFKETTQDVKRRAEIETHLVNQKMIYQGKEIDRELHKLELGEAELNRKIGKFKMPDDLEREILEKVQALYSKPEELRDKIHLEIEAMILASKLELHDKIITILLKRDNGNNTA